jgi:hypothetical protein
VTDKSRPDTLGPGGKPRSGAATGAARPALSGPTKPKAGSAKPGSAKPGSAKSGSAKSGSAKPRAGSTAAQKSAAVTSESVGSDPTEAGSPATGATLRWAIRLLLAEAVVLGLLTLVTIWAAITTANVSASSAAAVPVFTAICGAIVGGLGLALARGKSLARGPAIVIQMLLILISYYMIDGGLVWVGVPVMIVGLLGTGLLLAPSTRTALGLN